MLFMIGVSKLMGFLSVGAVNPATAAFLVNRYTALMAAVLMPVLINALLAHLFLNPGGIGSVLVLTLLAVAVMYNHREHYSRILQPD